MEEEQIDKEKAGDAEKSAIQLGIISSG